MKGPFHVSFFIWNRLYAARDILWSAGPISDWIAENCLKAHKIGNFLINAKRLLHFSEKSSALEVYLSDGYSNEGGRGTESGWGKLKGEGVSDGW